MKTVFVLLSIAAAAEAWAPAASTRLVVAPQVNKLGSSKFRLLVGKNIEKEFKDTTSDSFTSNKSSHDWKQPILYSELTIGVLKETYPGENRVSQTPDSIQSLVKAGFTVVVEAGGTLSFTMHSIDFHCAAFLSLFDFSRSFFLSWRESFVQ